MGIIVPDMGKLRDSDDTQLADKIIELKNAGKVWEVIDLLVKVWAARAPDEVKAQKLTISDYRENLKDKRFGQTEGGKDFQRRFILSFPEHLRLLIGATFKSDLTMDNKFYAQFAKKYPFFMIPEKL